MLTQRGGWMRRGRACVGVLREGAAWWRETSDIDHSHSYQRQTSNDIE